MQEDFILMDQACIDSVVKLIHASNIYDVDIYKFIERPIEYESNDLDDDRHCVTINFDAHICIGKAPLSEAWAAGNLLLFSVFDGMLENKHNLQEGASFKNHYDNLPENDDFEIMTKNCYRIFKIIRNGIQHSLSSVNHSDGYSISYAFKNTSYSLQISEEGARWLYTYVMNLITGSKTFSTDGHYNGIMRTIYENMTAETSRLSDEIGTSLLPVGPGLKLRAHVRYLLKNPKVVKEDDETITFYHLENNSTDDENDPAYFRSTDYVYNGYLLPQEMGHRELYKGACPEMRFTRGTITFKKGDITSLWKMH